MTIAAAALALVLAVLATWLPALDASFQFDDFKVIVEDPRVQSLSAWAASMPGIRPLLKASYALNHEWGAGARGFRALNVAIHAANAVLLMMLLRRLALRLGRGGREALAVAFFAALLFALHPVQTEAVTYVSGRSSSLVAFFCLAALVAAVSSTDAAPATATGLRVLAMACALLALGVKESAVMLPAALALWAWVPTGAAGTGGAAAPRGAWPASGGPGLSDWGPSLGAGLLLGLVAVTLLYAFTPYPDLIRAALARRSPWHSVMTQAHAVPYLIGNVVDPRGLNADPQLRVVTALDPGTTLRLLAVAAVLAAALAGRRRWPGVSFGVLWFALWLLPTNSIFGRDDLANDRQLYLALAGPAWMVALALARVARWRRAPAFAAAVLLGGALAAGTQARNQVYGTEISFWEDAARKSPGKARPHHNLGRAYAMACRDAEAAVAFERAMAAEPGDPRAAIAHHLLRRGRLFEPGERDCETKAR